MLSTSYQPDSTRRGSLYQRGSTACGRYSTRRLAKRRQDIPPVPGVTGTLVAKGWILIMKEESRRNETQQREVGGLRRKAVVAVVVRLITTAIIILLHHEQ